MTSRSLKRRWLRTKMALGQTIERILDINRRRKVLSNVPQYIKSQEDMDQELKILNRIADHQARLLRKYEMDLSTNQA